MHRHTKNAYSHIHNTLSFNLDNILVYVLDPYIFSSNDISAKRCRDVTCIPT